MLLTISTYEIIEMKMNSKILYIWAFLCCSTVGKNQKA